MLKHRAWRLRAGVRDGLANCGGDLPHHLPILHAWIAGTRLLDRQLDLGADQFGGSCKKDAGLIDRRISMAARPRSAQTEARSFRKL
jgi:hypothetical protein